MHKNVFGRQFKRDANERKALFKNLLTSLVMQERIRTTREKAKAIRGAADKLVTKAKKGGPNVYRSLHPDINHDAVKKLMEEIAPRFMTRNGGYTRIIKLSKRRVADNAPMVVMEWVQKSENLQAESVKLLGDGEEVKAEVGVKSKRSTKKTAKEATLKAEVEPKTKGKKKVAAKVSK